MLNLVNLNKRIRGRLGMVLILAGLSGPGMGQEDVYLKVQSGSFEPVAISVTDFRGNADPASTRLLREVVEDDLRYSGFFELEDHRETGAAVQLSGELALAGGQLQLTARLNELPGEQRIFEKTFTAERPALRRLAHQAADAVVQHLIGIEGVAQSQIVYIAEQKGGKELFVMDYDGHGSRQLTFSGTINLSPCWSPDGSRIAFTSYWKATRIFTSSSFPAAARSASRPTAASTAPRPGRRTAGGWL